MRATLATWGVAAAIVIAALPAAGKTTKTSAKHHEVDLIGCVQLEKEYRSDLGAKPGGPGATGAGQANEYVLVKAKVTSKTSDTLTHHEAVATAGQQGDYMLTGKLESELGRAIGRQVEIVGVVQPFRANKSAKEDRDRLPELAITAWHPVSDFCPA
jgi:hypothetical protein